MINKEMIDEILDSEYTIFDCTKNKLKKMSKYQKMTRLQEFTLGRFSFEKYSKDNWILKVFDKGKWNYSKVYNFKIKKMEPYPYSTSITHQSTVFDCLEAYKKHKNRYRQ